MLITFLYVQELLGIGLVSGSVLVCRLVGELLEETPVLAVESIVDKSFGGPVLLLRKLHSADKWCWRRNREVAAASSRSDSLALRTLCHRPREDGFRFRCLGPRKGACRLARGTVIHSAVQPNAAFRFIPWSKSILSAGKRFSTCVLLGSSSSPSWALRLPGVVLSADAEHVRGCDIRDAGWSIARQFGVQS